MGKILWPCFRAPSCDLGDRLDDVLLETEGGIGRLFSARQALASFEIRGVLWDAQNEIRNLVRDHPWLESRLARILSLMSVVLRPVPDPMSPLAEPVLEAEEADDGQ